MNKILLFVVVVVFLVVGGLIVNLGSDKDEASNQRASSASNAGATSGDAQTSDVSPKTGLTDAERDSYVNTIKTINARYRDLETRFGALTGKQAEVEKGVPTDKEIDDVVNRRVTDSASKLMTDFQSRLNAMKGDIEQRINARNDASPAGTSTGVPKGLGFDDLVRGGQANGLPGALRSDALRSEWSTVLPMGATEGESEGRAGGLLGWYSKASETKQIRAPSPSAQRTSAGGADGGAENTEDEEPIPVYTIPRNATLFSNDTLTALLGVIPVEGSILDPIRFKLITGEPNLATNGLYIPGVKNIVWSGIAIGNREMSCVRGELHSVTFTFEDGTIRTVSSGLASSDTTNRSKQILGYISDRRGSPCIRGQLITNANDYLRDRMFASGAAATANAFGSTQERTVTRSDGSTESYFRLDGDTGKYIGSKMLEGTLTELSQYLAERSRNAVDLVFVEAGQKVILHVESQIDIDYDPKGRKLEHDNPLSLAARHAGLD